MISLWFAPLQQRQRVLAASALAIMAIGMAAPAHAGRGTSIDVNTTEIWSDSEDAQHVSLPFAIDYGSGPQSNLTVQLPLDFGITNDGLSFAAVGLSVTGLPSDVLFATVNGSNLGGTQVPALRLSNATETSTPFFPVDEASTFDFGVVSPTMMTPPADTSDCDIVSGTTYCYGPMTSSATFQFASLATPGDPGAFRLILQCGELCGNIGFNLGDVSFSADDFDPNAPRPSQLVDFTLGNQAGPFHPGTWVFDFINVPSVPEPGTWASMLVGFALLGGALRRKRKLELQLS